ncbi:bacteriochlorophyll 4-vinyl reductase [Roseomonas sp. PWR1]|uniref:Bacteriochlorophyll 4-vinyl reductase n=1 Tax=Roseomonas nitratireducens TaxID=2820810 RepID=A0ABS4AR68_9PROT|nr:bacteriochlorophyll 4-vinyl reductase [Neoroseomonas nitratireducens]MBP0463348.1 bacteriochlorophyll 4-vinyl reductase [Neoroseomonas nitratireducens]
MSQASARIGPNAVTRLAEALEAVRGAGGARAVFGRAGLAHRLAAPPERMVEEAEVVALHAALRETLPAEEAEAIARDAGRRTADYLLAHRIPRPMRLVLPHLPARAAAWILLKAIGRHAWTFAGSGRFAVLPGQPVRFSIAGSPLARGAAATHAACGYYAATFEGLFRALVHPATRIEEVACEAMGAPCCLFEARWAERV